MFKLKNTKLLVIFSTILAIAATIFSYTHDYIIAYGDAESHLDIAKRVLQSLTPGFAQFGGVWLPLPHALMLPFVYSDYLWKTGLAGSIVSGIMFVVASIYIYKTTYLVTKSKLAGLVSYLVFSLNPNILYMQSTPMTEMPLIAFFILSSYYFIRFIQNDEELANLIAAAFFGFCASITRYDGWFLVLVETLIIILLYIPKLKTSWNVLEGKIILFDTLALMGVLLWLVWDWMILGDPLYFTNSQFSAKSQQAGWLAKGQLPTYHNLFKSLAYYTDASALNIGTILFVVSVIAFVISLAIILQKRKARELYIIFLLASPFIFNVLTLFLGQSVMFLPGLTPKNFESQLFNVRYGVLFLPAAAFVIGFTFSKISWTTVRVAIVTLIFIQAGIFLINKAPVITLADGTSGLSRAKRPDAEKWMASHYDGGFVLLDDYSRTMSVIRSNIPVKEVIYVGTKPYWEDSLKQPEKYARWIVVQQNDAVWNAIYSDAQKQGTLYKYFNKVYTSPDILIFKRI